MIYPRREIFLPDGKRDSSKLITPMEKYTHHKVLWYNVTILTGKFSSIIVENCVHISLSEQQCLPAWGPRPTGEQFQVYFAHQLQIRFLRQLTQVSFIYIWCYIFYYRTMKYTNYVNVIGA